MVERIRLDADRGITDVRDRLSHVEDLVSWDIETIDAVVEEDFWRHPRRKMREFSNPSFA
jgi:hypothetical protein